MSEAHNMATEEAEAAARAKKLEEIEKISVSTVKVDGSHLDEDTQGMLDKNFQDREKLAAEIRDMKIRSEKRKIERADREREERIAREEEAARRKAEAEEMRMKKEEEAMMRRLRREQKTAAAAALASANEAGASFTVTRKAGETGGQTMKEREKELQAEIERIAKEQAEAEKQVVLAQRIFVLDIEGFNADKLRQKAEGLFNFVKKLFGETYDQEKRYKDTGIEIQDLTARARQQQLAGGGTIKRVKLPEGEVDKIQEKYSGAPDKILMYSIFERSQDKRTYEERHMLFHGPMYAMEVMRIFPTRKVHFDADSGLPTYIPLTEEEIAEYVALCSDYSVDGKAPEMGDMQDPDEFIYTGEDDEE